MGERKVVNKYYPPDFDHTKLRKPKMPADKQVKTRMMLPFTCKCNICGTYIHIGTKFNMRKETLTDETYLDIEIIRFFFKCTRCTTEITMKTDPKNNDYICESNATRQYDERRDLEAAESALNQLKSKDDQDPMKVLEARTYESRREMDIIESLEEILNLSRLKADVDYDNLLNSLTNKRVREQEGNKQVERQSLELKHQLVKRIDETRAHKELTKKKEPQKPRGNNNSHSFLRPKFTIKKQVLE